MVALIVSLAKCYFGHTCQPFMMTTFSVENNGAILMVCHTIHVILPYLMIPAYDTSSHYSWYVRFLKSSTFDPSRDPYPVMSR